VQTRSPDVEEAGHVSVPLRSLLFVPGDSERKQAKALDSPADALILDLEDSVARAQLPAARVRVRELLLSRPLPVHHGAQRSSQSSQHPPPGSVAPSPRASDRSPPQLWVRVNAPASGQLLDDLVAIMPGSPDGLVLPKVDCASQIAEVDHYLTALEASEGRIVGATRLIVIATETPKALLALHTYPQVLAAHRSATARLAALTWGCEDLAAQLGASANSDAAGVPTGPFRLARSWCLLTCAAIGVQAIDKVFVDFRDAAGLQRELADARRDGFTGKLAIHPEQLEAINSAFNPTEGELSRARRIVAAFAASPQAGVLSLDGQMIDRPHLLQARRLLNIAAREAGYS